MMLSVILLSMLMIHDQTSDLWQQLELASELTLGLRDTVVGSGLLISILEKLS